MYLHAATGAFSKPFTVSISNMKYQGTGKLHSIESTFTLLPITLREDGSEEEYQGMVEGATGAFRDEDVYAHKASEHMNQVGRQLRRIDRGHRPVGEVTAGRLVSIIREASKHPKHGKLIGRNCLSTVIHPGNTTMLANFHYEDGATEWRLPHLVTPIETISDIEVRDIHDDEEGSASDSR